jgi:hypothetical protein
MGLENLDQTVSKIIMQLDNQNMCSKKNLKTCWNM